MLCIDNDYSKAVFVITVNPVENYDNFYHEIPQRALDFGRVTFRSIVQITGFWASLWVPFDLRARGCRTVLQLRSASGSVSFEIYENSMAWARTSPCYTPVLARRVKTQVDLWGFSCLSLGHVDSK